MKVFAVHMLRSTTWALDPRQDLSPTRGKLFATPAGGLKVTLSALPPGGRAAAQETPR
jgi:hypothetical protein